MITSSPHMGAICILFYLLSSFQLLSQTSDQYAIVEDLSYEVEMILPEELSEFTFINDLAVDPFGYSWITSHKGLSCYDGQKLIHYNNRLTKEDTLGADLNEIYLSSEGAGYERIYTSDGGLNIWTKENIRGNIICFNTQSRKIVRVIERKSLPFQEILASDKGGKTYSLTKATAESDITIECITCEGTEAFTIGKNEYVKNYRVHNGEHWILTRSHLYGFSSDGEVLTTIEHDQNIWFNQSSTDVLSFNFIQLGLSKRWDTGEEKMVDYFKTPNVFTAKSVKYFDDGDRIWFTDYQRRVVLWDKVRNTVEDYSSTINALASQASPNTLRGDLQRIVPTENGGTLLLFENSIFRFKPKQASDSDFLEPIYSGKPITSIRQIAEDQYGNIYASYYTGVAVKRKGNSEFIDFHDTRTAEHKTEASYSLTVVGDEIIWNSSVYDRNDGFSNFIHFDYHGIHVNHVLEKDSLWLYNWYGNEFIKYIIPTKNTEVVKEKLFEGPIASSAIRQTKDGFFWFATDQMGISIFDLKGNLQGHYTHQDLKLEKEDEYLYDLQINDQTVLYGTNIGLGILDRETGDASIHSIPYAGANNSPFPRKVYFIFPNKEGLYYLGTDKGLVLFNPSNLGFSILSSDHPLSDKEFNRNSYLKASDGRYYVGTIDGLYSFLPEELTFESETQDSLDISIYNLTIFNEKEEVKTNILSDWDLRTRVDLRPSDINIVLEYAAPTVKDAIWYAYRINGLSSEWSELSSEGKMEIYGLPPGQYVVELMAKVDPFTEKAFYRKLELTKSEYWYKRLWVLALFGLSLLGFISLVIRNRYRRKLAHERDMLMLRTKISSDLHDDVGSILGGLAIQSELMAKVVPENYRPKLSEMSNMSREAMELMRDTVWAMDPRKDRFKNLIDRMLVFAENTLSRVDIEYTFESDEKIGEQAIHPEVRQNIYLIFKEAITNIVKHSNASKVEIAIQIKNKMLQLLINDDGTVDQKNHVSSDGQGISNMKMRAKAIGGQLLIDNEGGFKVVLQVLS